MAARSRVAAARATLLRRARVADPALGAHPVRSSAHAGSVALGGWESIVALVLSGVAIVAVSSLWSRWQLRRLVGHDGLLRVPRRAQVDETDLPLDGAAACALCHRMIEQRSGRVVHLDVDRGVTRIQALVTGTTSMGSSPVMLQLLVRPLDGETTVQVTVWPAMSLGDGGISTHVLREVMGDLRRQASSAHRLES